MMAPNGQDLRNVVVSLRVPRTATFPTTPLRGDHPCVLVPQQRMLWCGRTTRGIPADDTEEPLS